VSKAHLERIHAFDLILDETALDYIRDRLPPDRRFLLERVRSDANKGKDVYRRAFLELLRNWQHLGIPLSQGTLDEAASELERLWWPDPEAEKCRRRQEDAKVLRARLALTELALREAKHPRPRSVAKDALARDSDHNSGEALRKALQPNRVNRRPRHKPRS
jgi:hypothetical protein